MITNRYQGPMQPWPGLERYARSVHLPKSDLAVFFYDTGDGISPPSSTPMVLIHGLADEADTWRHLAGPLSTEHRVIALDLPGYGRSDKPKQAYTVPFFQDIVLELMDALGIQRATLVGHSLGAIIAHSVALDHPECVERLVLIAGSLVARSQKLDTATLLFLIPGIGEWLYTRLRQNPDAAYATLAPYYAHLDRLPEADRKFLFQRVNERVWSDGQRRAFFSTFRSLARWLPAQQRGLPARLAKLAVPTIAIWGQADRMSAIENGRALAAMQPDARLVVVMGAGHDVHQEKPEEVLAAM